MVDRDGRWLSFKLKQKEKNLLILIREFIVRLYVLNSQLTINNRSNQIFLDFIVYGPYFLFFQNTIESTI